MTQENTNNENKMEVYKTGEIPLERRRAPRAPASIIELEKAPDLVAYWKVIRRRRWTVLIAFTVLFGGVLVETLKQKPVYRAKALLEIEKENPSLVTPQELFQIDEVSDSYLETEYKVLSSDHGVPVVGTVDELLKFGSRYGVHEVLIAVRAATGKQIQRFVEICGEADMKFKTVPSPGDIL